jgi:hypothetical protein
MNAKYNKYEVNEESLDKVSGGKLPVIWKSVITAGIKEFKSKSEAEIVSMGYTKDAQGLINYLLDQNFAAQLNLTEEDIETVKNFILNNY